MKERELASNFVSSLSLVAIALLAFSKKTRKEIGKRDGWRDVDTGESFFDGIMLHASHYSHDRRNPDYDTVGAGRMQTVTNHLKYHLDHVGNAKDIGLTEAQNNYAIKMLRKTPKRTRKWLTKNRYLQVF
ncbi:MAG: hypothetical protein ACTSYA_02340 [Candidatus Kariarchaeaceae archaeon]